MSITSGVYILFLAISVMLYYHVPKKWQWLVLLLDSVLFYLLNTSVLYTLIYLFIGVATAYFAGIGFEYFTESKQKKVILAACLIINVGILGLLKYTNLVLELLDAITSLEGKRVNWAAPLALSFYGLQLISYILDTYWGVTEAERNPLKLLLFTCYFPLMVSGPICRHSDLAGQLEGEHTFDYEEITSGMRRIAWGLAKKLVVADRLANFVRYMFSNPNIFSGIWVIVAGFLFVLQLYFDFSGCMDIVIGASRCFGIKLQENFRAPLLSKSVQEIWQRWHITLGFWLKNYVMYPLLKTNAFINMGERCKKLFGKKGKKIPSYIAMLVVWTLVGIWHGDSWKYVIGQGWWFWAIITLSQILTPYFDKLKKIFKVKEKNFIWQGFQVIRTWVLFSIGLIFFRADSLSDAIYMIGRLKVRTDVIVPLQCLYRDTRAYMGGKLSLAFFVIIILMQIFCEFKTYHEEDIQICITEKPTYIRWGCYIFFVCMILLTGAFGSSDFIYHTF